MQACLGMTHLAICNFIEQRMRSLCKETGHVCHHWIDDKIWEDLYFLDKKDEGKRAREYELRCHRLEVIAIPPHGADTEWKFKLRCRSCDYSQHSECSYQNDKALKMFSDEFLEAQSTDFCEK